MKLVLLIGTCTPECKPDAASEVKKIRAEATVNNFMARESCDDWLQESADTTETI